VSIYNQEADREGPLNERELALVRRLLSDPFAWPPEFLAGIRTRLSDDPPAFSTDAIVGFEASVSRAVPALPFVLHPWDADDPLTDLPGPGMGLNKVFFFVTGGGSLRSLGTPITPGSRVTMKNYSLADITVKHNTGGGPADSSILLMSDGADVILGPQDTLELMYVDTAWQQISLDGGGGSGPMAGDWKISARTADHADPAGGTWYIMNATTALPAGEAELIALIGANRMDMRGRLPVMVGTHADVNAIGDDDGDATVGNRRIRHRHTKNGGATGGSVQGVNPNPTTGGTGFTGGDRSDVVLTVGDNITVGDQTAGTPLDTPSYKVVGNGFYYGSGS
jgi:hypothetical protein